MSRRVFFFKKSISVNFTNFPSKCSEYNNDIEVGFVVLSYSIVICCKKDSIHSCFPIKLYESCNGIVNFIPSGNALESVKIQVIENL